MGPRSCKMLKTGACTSCQLSHSQVCCPVCHLVSSNHMVWALPSLLLGADSLSLLCLLLPGLPTPDQGCGRKHRGIINGVPVALPTSARP